jgi:ribosomal protein L6P/L9E
VVRINAQFFQTVKFYHIKHYNQATPEVNIMLSMIIVLLKRMIIGAGVGFKKYLRVRGVGYKFEMSGPALSAKVGYTHLIKKVIPCEFQMKFSRKSKVIRCRSKSLNSITGFLSALRSMRKPDIYKGKGIRYRRDTARAKPGKRKTKAVSKKKVVNKKKMLLRKIRKRSRRRLKISFKNNLYKKNTKT